MTYFFKIIALALFSLTLAACGHVKIGQGFIYEDEDPQAYGGLTMNRLLFCKNGLGAYEICDATAVDGKEEAEVNIEWKVDQAGQFHLIYSATDTKAFEAFKTIADVRARFGDIVADTLLSLAVPPVASLAAANSGVVVPVDPVNE